MVTSARPFFVGRNFLHSSSHDSVFYLLRFSIFLPSLIALSLSLFPFHFSIQPSTTKQMLEMHSAPHWTSRARQIEHELVTSFSLHACAQEHCMCVWCMCLCILFVCMLYELYVTHSSEIIVQRIFVCVAVCCIQYGRIPDDSFVFQSSSYQLIVYKLSTLKIVVALWLWMQQL